MSSSFHDARHVLCHHLLDADVSSGTSGKGGSSKFETKRRKFEGTGSGRALKLFLDGRKLLMRIKGTFFFPSQSEEDKCNGEMGQVENEVKRLRGKRIAW